MKIKENMNKLSPAEKKVGDYILEHPDLVQRLTISDIAQNSNVSKATVTRFCKMIGMNNFKTFQLTLVKEITSPSNINDLSKINKDDSPYQLYQKVTLSNKTALDSLIQTTNKKDFEKAVEVIKNSKRIAFFGVGGSAPISLDAENKFEKLGYPTTRSTDLHFMVSSISNFNSGDSLLLFSTSGETKDVIELTSFAKEIGVTTIAITSHEKSPLLKLADIKLCFPDLEGDQRVGSTTSRIMQLSILDALYLSVFHRTDEKVIANYQNARRIILSLRR